MTPCKSGVRRAVGYMRRVNAGEEVTSRKVVAQCQRMQAEFYAIRREDCPWRFDAARAERPIRFIERFLSPSKGDYDRMRLMDWQCFALAMIFGWVSKETGLRRFQEALIYVGSGNGKSTLMAGIAAFMASKDGERGADVCLFANSRDQASIVFEECKKQIANSPLISERFRVTRDAIYYDRTGSKIRSFASDSGKLDGLNPHAAVFDEIHEFQNFKLVNVVKRKRVKRRQPLFIYLTTAGYVNEGPLDYYYRLFSDSLVDGKLAKEVADRLFGLMYELDADDKIEDVRTWKKANPGLGYLLHEKDMEVAWETAKHIPQERADFICKNLNLKVNADESSFVDWSVLMRNDGVIDPAEVEGYEAYAGFDLSTREDFTSAAIVAPMHDGREYVLHHSWVPRKTLEASPEGADFYSWAMMGALTIIDGEYIQQDMVADWIIEQSRRFDLMSVGYDPANAIWCVRQLESKGIHCEVVRQGPITLNDPMKDVKELLLSGKLVSNNDPMLRWYMSNVRLSREARHADKQNWMPTKRKKSLKIDGYMAYLFAHTAMMRRRAPPVDEERYEIYSMTM